jgi:WD40 repeat protein
VDSVDLLDSSAVLLSLSSLEGNLWEGGLVLFDLENGSLLAYSTQSIGIPVARYTGQFKVIAGCDDGSIRSFSIENKSFESLNVNRNAHHDIISGITFNQTHMFTCSWDQDIKIWDLSNMNTSLSVIPNAHYNGVNAIACNKRSNQLASVGTDGILRIWDPRIDSSYSECTMLYSHDVPVASVEWDAGNEYYLYTGTDSGELYQFDIRNINDCSKINLHNNRIRAIKSNASFQNILCTCSDDALIKVINTQNGDILHNINTHNDYVSDIVILPNTNEKSDQNIMTICSGSTDKSVKLTEVII